MVLYLASDLIWATRIKATAEDVGVPARPIRSIDMLEARLADSPVKAIILDLETPQVAFEVIARLRAPGSSDPERGIRILAFGPHIHRDLLDQARQAGADVVLTRGAFDHNLADILTGLETESRI
ncbi:MAG: hypothetical protein KF866_00495 [Phycisphaeraceae bacterium]|nr:hypothetical protein [Phycisphaeraceae bacterium]MCW5753600.1 hypothetical protein [Phycisphaeraceae bacterium]